MTELPALKQAHRASLQLVNASESVTVNCAYRVLQDIQVVHALRRFVVGHVCLVLQQLHDHTTTCRTFLCHHLLVVWDVAHGTNIHVTAGNAAGEGSAEQTPYLSLVRLGGGLGSHFV